ncbi:DUF3987 domain-containing protein [Klebsiella aerogenes]
MNKKNAHKNNQEHNLRFELLPSHFRRWALHLHYITGVAVEIIVVTLLAFLGLACQDLCCVQLGNKQRSPLALYLLLLSRSGSGKSRIFRLLKVPVEQLEREFEDAYRAELEEYERKIILWEAEFKVLNKLYKKELSQRVDSTASMKNLDECLRRKPKKPIRKFIILTNPTSEALAKELGLGYPNKALFNDEAAGVYTSGLYNDPAPFNTFWCWDKVTINRVSRQSFVIENYVFSSFLMMQPYPYNNGSRQKRSKIRYTGLLARTLMIDLEQITELCTFNENYAQDEVALDELYSVMTELMKSGVERRENNDEYTDLTLTPDAQVLLDNTSSNLQQHMKPGGSLHHYDDIGARYIEQSLRIAGVFQISCDPDSTAITNENLLSALHLTDWFITHTITKLDATRELSDVEKLLNWLEAELDNNRSFVFQRNKIIKYGPAAIRSSERLMPALEKLEEDSMVQQYKESVTGINCVKFVGSETTPDELWARLNLPLEKLPEITRSKLPR